MTAADAPAGVTPAPYRLVDAHNQGWYRAGGGRYMAFDDAPPVSLVATLDDIARDRGPWRPVQEMLPADVERIRGVFARTGRKAIATLAAAIEQVYHEVRESQGGLTNPDSHNYAVRTLVAGRPGSWESATLKSVIWFGNALNLAPVSGRGQSSPQRMREAGPSRRVDVDGRAELAAVLTRWVTDPDRYTEVAANLGSVVSGYADEAHGAGGWAKVADQWLQPGGLDSAGFSACYRLFYSTSRHFDGGALP